MGKAMDLLRKVDVPEGEMGHWEVKKFSVSKEEAEFDRLRCMIHRGRGDSVPEGSYTKLTYRGGVVMSDTPGEMREHWEIVRAAKGRVLIAGLGLGVVLQAVADQPEVEHVTVFENSVEVVELVWNHYEDRYGDKISLETTDFLSYLPSKEEKYDAAWFDIWSHRCEDDLKEHTLLLKRWARRAAWRGCWIHDELMEQRRGY